MTPTLWTWVIAGLTTLGVIIRPFSWPEAIWAVGGAILTVAADLMSIQEAWAAVLKGLDVYLFLTGMMILSELAREEGVFAWLAGIAISYARGSATRLFAVIYIVGTVVTVFLSNDATAVVLTPAVYAATRAAGICNPRPYLFVCAFVANAASFVLPISNPANLVVFGAGHIPPLLAWLKTFALPSVLSILATYIVLWASHRDVLAAEKIATDVERPQLLRCGKVAAGGVLATAVILSAASALRIDLGLPTLIAALATAALILAMRRQPPTDLLQNISWGVLPLVAGLFVMVGALDRTGVIRMIAQGLHAAAGMAPLGTVAAAGALVAVVSNVTNNLPSGLVAGSVVQQAGMPSAMSAAMLIGVDLGPNLSVTGSLATILWLTALRREGQKVSAWQFLRLGLVVMPPALLLALAGILPGT